MYSFHAPQKETPFYFKAALKLPEHGSLAAHTIVGKSELNPEEHSYNRTTESMRESELTHVSKDIHFFLKKKKYMDICTLKI